MRKHNLIILSGWGIKSFVWNKLQKCFTQDYNFIIVEWEDMLSPEKYKRKLSELISQNGIEAFSLLGWSMGSLAAIDIAAGKCRRLKHLILIGGTGAFIQHKEDDYFMGWNKKIVERMQFQLHNRPEETLCSFYQRMFSKTETQSGCCNEFMQAAKSTLLHPCISDLCQGLDYLIKKDFRKKLPDIQVPLLLLHGNKDQICPPEAAKYIKNIVAQATLIILHDSGHIPFYTRPLDCYQAISEFISFPHLYES